MNIEHIKKVNNAYSEKYNYLIKWNAKCGCTLFRRFFLELHKNDIKIIDKEWENGLQSFKLSNYNNPIIKHKILLTRNPYKRVVSMFTNKYLGRNTVDNLQKKFKINKNTFYDFVLKLKEFKDNNNWPDIHLTPQLFNYENNDILIKLENFENIRQIYINMSFNDLLQSVNNFLSKDYGYINKTDNRDNSNIFIGYKEYSDYYEGPWPDYKYFYDEDIKKLVYEIYKKDFINLDYDFNSI